MTTEDDYALNKKVDYILDKLKNEKVNISRDALKKILELDDEYLDLQIMRIANS